MAANAAEHLAKFSCAVCLNVLVRWLRSAVESPRQALTTDSAPRRTRALSRAATASTATASLGLLLSSRSARRVARRRRAASLRRCDEAKTRFALKRADPRTGGCSAARRSRAALPRGDSQARQAARGGARQRARASGRGGSPTCRGSAQPCRGGATPRRAAATRDARRRYHVCAHPASAGGAQSPARASLFCLLVASLAHAPRRLEIAARARRMTLLAASD